jgi:hypothetical protein
MDGQRGLEVTSRREAVELLATAALVRVVFTHRAMPIAIQVAFAVDGYDLVIRTGHEARLRGAMGSVVAVEADHFDPDTAAGWSVIVQGIAEEITDQVDRLGQQPGPSADPPTPRRLRPGPDDQYLGTPDRHRRCGDRAAGAGQKPPPRPAPVRRRAG